MKEVSGNLQKTAWKKHALCEQFLIRHWGKLFLLVLEIGSAKKHFLAMIARPHRVLVPYRGGLAVFTKRHLCRTAVGWDYHEDNITIPRFEFWNLAGGGSGAGESRFEVEEKAEEQKNRRRMTFLVSEEEIIKYLRTDRFCLGLGDLRSLLRKGLFY